MIEEQFVSFDTARMLKEAGFGEHCRCMYFPEKGGCHKIFQNIIFDYDVTNDDKYEAGDYYGYGDCYLAPTQSLAERWLREVHGIHVYAIQTNLPYTEPQTTKWEWGYVIDKIDDPNSNIATCEMYFGSYEDAFEAGIAKCLELIKK